MYEPVDAPLPVPSPRSLLSVAQLLNRIREGSLSTSNGEVNDDQEPGAPATRAGVSRWVNDGVTFTQEACGTIEGGLLICEGEEGGTDPAGNPQDAGDIAEEDAMRFRVGSRCSRMSGPQTQAEVQARAERMLGLWQHQYIADQFWDNQLRDGAVITSATGLAVIDGLATVEEAMAGMASDPDADNECGPGQRAMIHVNPRTLTIMAALGLVRETAGLLVTALESVIVSGPGYSGNGPEGQSGASASDAWIYGSGFVDVRLSPVLVNAEQDRLDNDLIVYASRAAVVTVGACCVVGAKLDLTNRG
jgi:hypothetical protein